MAKKRYSRKGEKREIRILPSIDAITISIPRELREMSGTIFLGKEGKYRIQEGVFFTEEDIPEDVEFYVNVAGGKLYPCAKFPHRLVWGENHLEEVKQKKPRDYAAFLNEVLNCIKEPQFEVFDIPECKTIRFTTTEQLFRFLALGKPCTVLGLTEKASEFIRKYMKSGFPQVKYSR